MNNFIINVKNIKNYKKLKKFIKKFIIVIYHPFTIHIPL